MRTINIIPRGQGGCHRVMEREDLANGGKEVEDEDNYEEMEEVGESDNP